MPEDVCSSFPFYHHLPFKTVLVCGAISSVVTPGTVEVAPAGAQAQHAQPATKQENILGCGLTHTQKVNTVTGLGHFSCDEDDDGCSATPTEDRVICVY